MIFGLAGEQNRGQHPNRARLGLIVMRAFVPPSPASFGVWGGGLLPGGAGTLQSSWMNDNPPPLGGFHRAISEETRLATGACSSAPPDLLLHFTPSQVSVNSYISLQPSKQGRERVNFSPFSKPKSHKLLPETVMDICFSFSFYNSQLLFLGMVGKERKRVPRKVLSLTCVCGIQRLSASECGGILRALSAPSASKSVCCRERK